MSSLYRKDQFADFSYNEILRTLANVRLIEKSAEYQFFLQ